MAASQASLYGQKEKKECRSRLIEHAIKCLTTERDTSVCVTRNHVVKTWTNLNRTQEVKQHFSRAERLNITNAVKEWIKFHQSRIKTMAPEDLRVCYLAGDNPMNDLEVLVQNGILLQNIWAIEKDSTLIEKAVEAVRQPESKYFKLFKVDLIEFLIHFEDQFDIIYYDACGTLPSARQRTLEVIGTVFLHNKLTSPGALITNFSFPPTQAPGQDRKNLIPQSKPWWDLVRRQRRLDEERNRIRFLAESYLTYRELNTPLSDQDHSEKGTRSVEDTYSDYITFQVIDSAAVYIPAQKMLRSSLWNQLYSDKTKFLEKVKLYDTRKEYSQTSSGSYLRMISSVMKNNISTNSLCERWRNEILPNWKTSMSLENEEISSLLLTHHLSCSEEFIGKFANEDFQKRCLELLKAEDQALDPADTNGTMPPSLCDTLDAACATRLVGGIHYGQLAKPSFPVVNKSLRLRYTAKTRMMFSDVFIFDKCPYLYDQFPSVDFGINSITSEQQMLIKMIVNGLRSHLREICYDQFCNVADLHVNSLQIPQRENIDAQPDESPDPLREAHQHEL